MEELELFKSVADDIAREIMVKFVAFTGVPVPSSYKLPPIKFVQGEFIQKIGKKPLYYFIASSLEQLEKQFCDYNNRGEKIELLYFMKKLEAFINTTKSGFDETVFDELDDEWLGLIERLQKRTECGDLDKAINNVQAFMDMLYEREYDFVVCGDYSYNQQMIYLYETNISNRLTKDSQYVLIPPRQALECMLAHEIFHSLHFMAMHDGCLANNTTMLKLFNPPGISNSLRNTIIKKRKTVIESLAKYFEYCYARSKEYTAYANYEKYNFVGKRKHYPAWPYAGAKGLIDTNNDEAFRDALRASIAIAQGRGFSAAYEVIDRVNREA